MTTTTENRHHDKDLDTESLNDSSEYTPHNKFWARPDDSPEPTMRDEVNADHGDPERTTTTLLSSLHDSAKQAVTHESKRRQTKMLLVSLIESFCRIYGDTPEANNKVFFLICQTLHSLGFIDSEFEDEMAGVRSTFHRAFQKLFSTAVRTVRKQDFRLEQQQRLITVSPWLLQGQQVDAPLSPTSTSDYFHPQSTMKSSSSDYLFLNLSIQNSRYCNDFIEISLLGRGGFASAWRARNKLDDIEYAIKKIRLGKDLLEHGGQNPYRKIFREIKNLARLEHRNVVRYYASWLEFAESTPTLPERLVESEEDSSRSEHSSRSISSNRSVFNGQDPTFEDEPTATFTPVKPSLEDMSHIEFAHDMNSQKQPDGSKAASQHAHPSPETQDPENLSGPEDIGWSNRKRSLSNANGGWTLFIQMQLCPSTLHEYIKFRNRRCIELGHRQVDKPRNIEIFSQILEGAAYIHEQGLIHRDLKPSNIFLSMPTSGEHRRQHRRASSNLEHGFSYDSVLCAGSLRECMWEEAWVPKIGDFGLAADAVQESDVPLIIPPASVSPAATTVLSSSTDTLPVAATIPCSSSVHSSPEWIKRQRPRLHRKRTSCVGTRTYASPEQLANPPISYDEKSDIYSLGIIFFELYQPFSTSMERAEAIEKLKRGVFPEGFVETYPKESALILWMMDDNPTHRPSAGQLLDFEFFAPTVEQDICVNLQAQLQAKNREMAELLDRMERSKRESEREVGDLHRKVEALQQQLKHASLAPIEMPALEKVASEDHEDVDWPPSLPSKDSAASFLVNHGTFSKMMGHRM